VLSAEELAALRREIESFDTIEQIDHEMRALINPQLAGPRR
jgi:hypothetical protein